MKNLIAAFVLCILAVGLYGAPKAEKASRSYHTHSPNYDKGEYISISNEANAYLVYLQWMKVTPKCDGGVTVGIPEPVYRNQFVNRDFTTLKVNGISSKSLEPRSINIFNEADKAGVDLLYNFDGVKMNQRFYMQGESPMLFMEWSKVADSEESIETAEMSLSTYPDYSVPNGGKKSELYKRVIQTPANKYGPFEGTKWVTFKQQDTSFIMYDEAFEPSNTPKAQGPCYMAMDWKGIKAAKCWFGQIYCMNYQFKFDKDADKWQFAFWEYKKSMNNQEFFDMLKEKAPLFAIPSAAASEAAAVAK